MKNTHFLPLLISILFIACNNPLESDINADTNKYKKISFEKVKEVKLPLGKHLEAGIDHVKYEIIDGEEILIIAYWASRKLVFYNINTQNIINEFEFERNLYDFKYISKDSILLLYKNRQLHYNDKQLVLVNFNGKEQHKYVYNNKLINYKNDILSEELAVYPSLFGNKIELFNDNIFLFLNKQKEYKIGTDSFFINKSPIVSYYNTKTEKLTTSENLWYPFIQPRDYYPSDFPTLHYCMSNDSLPLIRFFYSSKLFKWDYRNDKITEYSLKSKFLDTIPPMYHPSYFSDSKIPAMYYSINYDKYNELYYSTIYFSYDIYNGGSNSLIIADKNLNYIGEVFAPKINGYNPIFTKDYIISTRESKTGGFYIEYYKLKLTDISNADYENYISSIKDTLKVRKRSKKNWQIIKESI